MTRGIVAARYLATTATNMTSMIQPVAAVEVSSRTVQLALYWLRLTKDCVQRRKWKCHIHELHVLTESVCDSADVCIDEEAKRSAVCSERSAQASSPGAQTEST